MNPPWSWSLRHAKKKSKALPSASDSDYLAVCQVSNPYTFLEASYVNYECCAPVRNIAQEPLPRDSNLTEMRCSNAMHS